MKALVRKYGFTPTKASQNEVYPQTQWHDWINPDTGAPLTDENLGYALCENCPEDYLSYLPEEGNTDPTTLFEVTEHTKEIPSDYPDEPTQKVRYWTAIFIGKSENVI